MSGRKAYWLYAPSHNYKNYRVEYRDRPGRKYSTGTADPEQASQWAINHLHDPDPKRPVTLKQFAGNFFVPGKCTWLKRRKKKGQYPRPSTLASWRRYLINYLLADWGEWILSSISGRDLDNWLIDLKDYRTGKDLSFQTKNHIRHVVKIVFQDAVDEGLIDINPIHSISRFANEWQSMDLLPLEEVLKLFPAVRKKLLKIWHNQLYVALFAVLFDSGYRPCEIRAIQWRHWRRSKHGMVITQDMDDWGNLQDIKGSRPGKKVKKPARLSKRTEQELLLWKSKSKHTNPLDFIFCRKPGKPVSRRTINRRFTKAIEKAKIKPAGRRLSPYSLRHKFDTDMLKGLPIPTVQTLMGHSTDKMTRHYADFTDEELLELVDPASSVVEARWKDEKKTQTSGPGSQ